MSRHETALERGRREGAFAAIAVIAAVEDLSEAANAYREAMRAAYWEDHNVTLATAIAYGGVSRLLAGAATAKTETASEARSAAKALMYNLASFTWPGWDEPGIEVSASEAASGLAAARSNLAMAFELEKGDLPVARANWMLGAHLLTAGSFDEAAQAFADSARRAELAGAEAEVRLAGAFGALTALAAGEDGAEERLRDQLALLNEAPDGADFVSQVETAGRVLGLWPR
jgi:hypothetical protein